MKTTHLRPGVNAQWHRHHRMPPDPTLDQRLAWHEAHVHNCGCWPMPASLVDAMRRRLRGNCAGVGQDRKPRGASR
jgi:hypothetical protein